MKQARQTLLILLFLVGALIAQPARGADNCSEPGKRFDTGHTVSACFLDYYYAHGGQSIFGQPLTSEFIMGQAIVQFFENVVLERPLTSGSDAIRLLPIAERMGKGEPPLPASAIPEPGDPERRYFPETGHSVCRAFLTFLDAYGGTEFFGPPIAEVAVENGIIVQYFRNARLEWHTDPEGKQEVKVGQLATEYLHALSLPDTLLRVPEPAATPTSQVKEGASDLGQPTAKAPTPTPMMDESQTRPPEQAPDPCLELPSLPTLEQAQPSSDTTLQRPPKLPLKIAGGKLVLSVAVRYAILPSGGQQRVHIVVRDGQGVTVPQAQIELTMYTPDDTPSVYNVMTDNRGRATLSFAAQTGTPGGLVILDIWAKTENARGFAQASFTIWP